MTFKTKSLFCIWILVVYFTSCSEEVPEMSEVPNEVETITSLTYKLIPVGGGDVVEITYSDQDGEGGFPASISLGLLAANTVYNGFMELKNGLSGSEINITNEILEEAEDHQFFFDPIISSISVEYMDSDSNGNPLGIKTKLTTSGSDAGRLRMALIHLPDKNGPNVSEGIITAAGGEIDIELIFNIKVE